MDEKVQIFYFRTPSRTAQFTLGFLSLCSLFVLWLLSGVTWQLLIFLMFTLSGVIMDVVHRPSLRIELGTSSLTYVAFGQARVSYSEVDSVQASDGKVQIRFKHPVRTPIIAPLRLPKRNWTLPLADPEAFEAALSSAVQATVDREGFVASQAQP